MTGATQTTRTIKLPMPHAGQQHVWRNRRRTTLLAAGRRWRKTTLFMSLCVESALQGTPIVWGAPTYDQTFTAWEEFRRAGRGAIKFNQSRMEATIGRGSVIFRSLDDPDNARSKTAGGIVIDEAGDVKGEAWAEVLRPMLMDTNGWALIGGTPKGRNWFWQECQRAADDPDCIFFQAPTMGAAIVDGALVRTPHPLENPHIPWSEIVKLHASMPERSFRQEILAEFIEDGGEVFRNVRPAVGLVPRLGPGEPIYVAGIDWGREHDYTVVTILDARTQAMVACERWTGLPYEAQIGRIIALFERYRPEIVIAEQNSMGGPIVERLFYEFALPVRPFVTTHQSKVKIIDALALAFERAAVGILDLPWLIGELEAYSVQKTTAVGLPTYGAPDNMHDDGVISLALAWQGVLWQNGGEV